MKKVWSDVVDIPPSWNGDIDSFEIALLAEKGGGFNFLLSDNEDIYSVNKE